MSALIDFDSAYSPNELELLRFYREADAADKRRLWKLMRAAKADLLPDLATIKTLGPDGVRAFADSLPENAA